MNLQSEKIPTRSKKEQLIDIDLRGISDEIDLINGSIATISGDVGLLTPLYTEIAVKSSEILTMGSEPIELLPAPGAGTYYVIERIAIEYTFKTAAYVFPTSNAFYLDGCFDSYIDKTLLTATKNTVCVISGNLRNTYSVGSGSGSTFVKTNKDVLDSSLIMSTQNSDNPTTGDGSLLVKITYRIESFGG